MRNLNKTLVYFLIFTIVASAFAFKIIVKGYDNAFADYSASVQ